MRTSHLLIAFGAMASSSLAFAVTTYSYRGESYDHFSHNPYGENTLSSSNYLVFAFTLENPLSPLLSSVQLDPHSWIITDGLFEISSATSGEVYSGGSGEFSSLSNLYVSTDENGNIFSWSFGATKTQFNQWSNPEKSITLGSNGCLSGCLNNSASSYNYGSTYGTASNYGIGAWSAMSSVPEPSVGLLACAGILLGLRRAHRTPKL